MVKALYDVNDNVRFELRGEMREYDGVIFIADKYGIFEDNTQPYYDIFVKSENMLYKHIPQTSILRKND